MPSQTLVFHGRAKHIKVRYNFLRDHVEKGDIVMKFTDTDRQLADIFTKPHDSSRFAALPLCRGKLVFAIPMAWFEGEFVLYLVYLYLLLFSCIFFILTYVNFASLVILACI
jgi:hypothetical protein